jgi:Na+/phosphate symporter
MTLDVETIVAVCLMMAVFSAVAAVGTSLVLGAGFERLRNGFEIVRKQTGFFSDAIHKLEQKVEIVDEQTGKFTNAIHTLESKVSNVGEQANLFAGAVGKLEEKVGIVDRQTGFFSDAIHKLEKQVEIIGAHEQIVSKKMENGASNDLISTGKAEALVSHAEDLLTQMSMLAHRMQEQKADTLSASAQETQTLNLKLPEYANFFSMNGSDSSEEVRYH